jgi:hypothetical protein
MPPAPEEAPPVATAENSCPSFDVACREGVDFVESECPIDGDYKKSNGYRKCRRAAIDSYLEGLESCFRRSELKSLGRCIISSLPIAGSPAGGTAKKHAHSEE